MHKYQTFNTPNDITVTSQSGLFCAIFNNSVENDPFLCGFQLSYYRVMSWTNFILCEYMYINQS